MGKLDVVGSNLANLLLGEIKVEPIDLYMKDKDEVLGSVGWEIVGGMFKMNSLVDTSGYYFLHCCARTCSAISLFVTKP
jgi:hypothetical protein